MRSRYSQVVVVRSRNEVDGLDRFTRQYLAVSERQQEAYESTRRNIRTLFGGAKGGAKSVGGVRILQRDVATSRGGIHLVTRRNFTDLQRTTRQSYEQFFPPELVISRTETEWRLINDWRIWFYAADETKDRNFEKLGGLEVTTIHNDEVSQQPETFYEAISAALRRDAINVDTGEPLPHYVYDTCNPIPGPHWTKRHFIDPRTRRTDDYCNPDGTHVGHRFIQSLPDDNPLLPPTYISTAFGSMTGAMLSMLRYGRWDVEESEFVIIDRDDIDCVSVDQISDRDPIGAGIDIGLGRPDATVVWCVNRRGEMWRQLTLKEYDTTTQEETLEPICARVNRNGGKVLIDAASIGKGVADHLRLTFGTTIVPTLFAEAAEEERGKRQYKNRRAQLYYWAREDVQSEAREPKGRLAVEASEELTEELAATYFLPTDDLFQLEPKAKIKDRLKRSPDDADAWVMCNAARRMVVVTRHILPRTGGSTPRKRNRSTLNGFRL